MSLQVRVLKQDLYIQALLFCFGAGADNGVLLVQDMLTKYMGFVPGSVSISSSDENQDRLSPVLRFKMRLAQLLEGTQAGDIRFLYVDGPGTRHSETADLFFDSEDGGHDSHWILLDDGNGDIIDCDWISQTIRAVSNIVSAAQVCFY